MNKVYLLFVYMLTKDRKEWRKLFRKPYLNTESNEKLYTKMVGTLRTAGQNNFSHNKFTREIKLWLKLHH